MTMSADGALHRDNPPATAFARHYEDAAQADTRSLLVFDAAPDEGSGTQAAPRVARSPRPEVLAGIEATAIRYAGHGALRLAGVSAMDWLTLYQANIEVESGYDPAAVSPVGAVGLGQLMPDTASRLRVDPRDWRQNLDGSARYLLAQIGRFGTADLALAAYNAGPAAVEQHGGIPPYPETQAHVRRVRAVMARLKGDTGS